MTSVAKIGYYYSEKADLGVGRAVLLQEHATLGALV